MFGRLDVWTFGRLDVWTFSSVLVRVNCPFHFQLVRDGVASCGMQEAAREFAPHRHRLGLSMKPERQPTRNRPRNRPKTRTRTESAIGNARGGKLHAQPSLTQNAILPVLLHPQQSESSTHSIFHVCLTSTSKISFTRAIFYAHVLCSWFVEHGRNGSSLSTNPQERVQELLQVPASLSRQLHFRDCEDRPCKVKQSPVQESVLRRVDRLPRVSRRGIQGRSRMVFHR